MININAISKRYSHADAPVLNNLSLTVSDGNSVSIRGASGSGKSTLLSLIAGFESPDSGSITIGSQTLPFSSEKNADIFRRRELGVIFQSYNLIECLNVWDNIAFTCRLKGNSDDSYQLHIMALLGITHLKNKPAHQLSGGEQQRVAISRALVHKPTLVLADEPTGNLDEDTSDTVSDALYSLCRSLDTTLVVVTHSEDVARMATQQCWLRHGQLHSEPA
ncbi:ABC transporter ATP-binding protein [Salinimonas sp. HHU 13199]|uniref:ABC transporter ATP-binding protein n=1 Tax=Salinimonas profundi TaxID=2729140 RepID=A0ABR8LMR0_9ALTE|nr:ABC transporter ATP-binding protein [Salinimonas profundi]MBD3586575.1 ABC transporter ATP-binding protein [Salinimonas profundi]